RRTYEGEPNACTGTRSTSYRRASLASRRLAASRAIFFLLMDAWRRTIGEHQRAHGVRCGGSELSLAELGWERMEAHRTTGTNHLDGLPPRRSTALVGLFGLFQRPLLRAPRCGAVLRW